jgi:hypothetical protein
MKFTFKTEKPTGRHKSLYPDIHYIKLHGHEVGVISHVYPFEIRLKVVKKDINEDGNPNCVWRWVTLAKKSNDLTEAKEYLNNHIETIMELCQLYMTPTEAKIINL